MLCQLLSYLHKKLFFNEKHSRTHSQILSWSTYICIQTKSVSVYSYLKYLYSNTQLLSSFHPWGINWISLRYGLTKILDCTIINSYSSSYSFLVLMFITSYKIILYVEFIFSFLSVHDVAWLSHCCINWSNINDMYKIGTCRTP